MSDRIISLPNFDKDEEIIINKRARVQKPRFTMIGNKMKSIDIIADMNKPEAFAFKLLNDNRDYENNIVLFSTGSLSATDKVVFSKGYKSLEHKGLITRTKKGRPSVYLFNPRFIIPNDYDVVSTQWDERTMPL